jgi:hypothetical protein
MLPPMEVTGTYEESGQRDCLSKEVEMGWKGENDGDIVYRRSLEQMLQKNPAFYHLIRLNIHPKSPVPRHYEIWYVWRSAIMKPELTALGPYGTSPTSPARRK